MKNILYLLAIICLLTNCASPKLTNWDRGNYDYYDTKGRIYKKNLHEIVAGKTARPLNHPVIKVSVAAVPLPKQIKVVNDTRKFTDYSEKVQLALLKKLTTNPAKNKVIIDALKADYSEAQPVTPNTNRDYTDIKLRLYFSNVKRYFNDARLMHPNTRLAFLNTTVKIENGSNMMFQSVDKLENEFESIDMGKLERSNDVTFSSKLSGDISAKVNTENNNVSTDNNTTTNEIKTYDQEGNELTSNTTTTNASNNTSSPGNSNSNSNTNVNGSTNSSSNNNTNNTTNTATRGNTNTRNTKGDFGQSLKGEAALEMKNSIKEAINVNFKRLKTGFSLHKKSLTVSQQGSLLRDVNDVTILTVSFEFNNDAKKKEDVLELANLFDADGLPNTIDKIKHKVTTITYYPCYSKEISNQQITYSYDGAIRAPKNLKRGHNILEYDDKVNYFAFDSNCLEEKDCGGATISTINTLEINKFTFCKQVFRLKLINKKTGASTNLLLAVNGDVYVPRFEGKTAYDLLDWLKAIGGMKANIYDNKALLSFFTVGTPPQNFNIRDYDFELDDVDSVPGKFVVTQGIDGSFQFSLNDPKGTIVLTSSRFSTDTKYKEAIAYLKKNGTKDFIYQRNTKDFKYEEKNKDGKLTKLNTVTKYYFDLITDENDIIGTSGMFETAVERDNTIQYFKTIMNNAIVEDLK